MVFKKSKKKNLLARLWESLEIKTNKQKLKRHKKRKKNCKTYKAQNKNQLVLGVVMSLVYQNNHMYLYVNTRLQPR